MLAWLERIKGWHLLAGLTLTALASIFDPGVCDWPAGGSQIAIVSLRCEVDFSAQSTPCYQGKNCPATRSGQTESV